MQLSSAVKLPHQIADYAEKLKAMFTAFKLSHGTLLEQHDINLSDLKEAIEIFSDSAAQLLKVAEALNDSSRDSYVRIINDKLFLLNRAFLDFNGLPGRPYYRHVIFAPSAHNSYNVQQCLLGLKMRYLML